MSCTIIYFGCLIDYSFKYIKYISLQKEDIPFSDIHEKLEVLAKEPLGIKVMTDVVCKTVNEELTNVCRRSENSVLRKREYEGLSSLAWKEICVEIESKCPVTMQFLTTLVDGKDDDGKKMPPVCLMYSIPVFLRVPELSRLQRLNTILLTDGGTSKMVSLSHVCCLLCKTV